MNSSKITSQVMLRWVRVKQNLSIKMGPQNSNWGIWNASPGCEVGQDELRRVVSDGKEEWVGQAQIPQACGKWKRVDITILEEERGERMGELLSRELYYARVLSIRKSILLCSQVFGS